MLNKPEEIRALTLLIIAYLGNEIDCKNLEPAVLATGLVEMTDYVDCIDSLNRDNLIFIIKSNGKDRCGVTKKGKSILPELQTFIPDGIRDEALRCAWRYYEALVNGIEYYTALDKTDDGYILTTGVKINKKTTCEAKSFFDTEKEAISAKKNCETRPQAVVNTILAAMTGDVNFIM